MKNHSELYIVVHFGWANMLLAVLFQSCINTILLDSYCINTLLDSNIVFLSGGLALTLLFVSSLCTVHLY